MNNIVDHIYVINMKKDTDRLIKYKNRVKDLFTYEIIEGVDPESENYQKIYNKWKDTNLVEITKENFDWKYYINRYYDLQKANIDTKNKAWNHWTCFGLKELRSCNPNNNIVNAGQWGCLYSHINVIKDAIDKNYENILILEDDIILTKNFEERINEIKELMTKNSNWKIIYLGIAQDNWTDILIKYNYYYANDSRGAFAYIVNRSIYKILLLEFEKMKNPVDCYLMKDIQSKYYKQIYVIYPNLIIANLEESNTGMIRDNSIWYDKFRWNMII